MSNRKRPLYHNLDSLPDTVVKRQSKILLRTFFVCVVVALFFGIVVIAITALQIVFEPFWWTLYLRSLAFVRTVILLFLVLRICLCRRISVLRLYGMGEESQCTSTVKRVFLLWAWRFLGYLDLCVGRILPLIADVVSLAARPDIPAMHALIRLGVGVVVLIEYYMSMWLVHERGIWDNVNANLYLRKAKRSS